MAVAERQQKRSALAVALAREEDKLLACVHCGFCLPACPTYTRLGDEADSPRGRLYLMRALVEGRLEPDADAAATHLDRCLGCRACETVCPAGVEYGYLLERARAVVADARGTSASTRLLLTIFGNRLLTLWATAGGRMLRATGLLGPLIRRLPRRFAGVRFSLAMLAATRPWPALRTIGTTVPGRSGRRSPVPPTTSTPPGAPAPSAPPAPEESYGVAPTPTAFPGPEREITPTLHVALLTGCVQEGLFARVNRATARVLEANRCEVQAVPGQRCCGALHAHGGDLDSARALARTNVDAFEAAGVDAIIVNAAGCGAAMKEYGALLADDPAYADRARAFTAKVRDVSELLAELGPALGAPLPLRVTYDSPCHLEHAQRITRAPLDLLRSIPGLDLIPLPDADECCGGAGIYGLTHPELGGRILDDKVAAVRTTGADVVVTPNPGCMMQIGGGLLLAGETTPVLHPVELLDESYRRARGLGFRTSGPVEDPIESA